MRSNHPVGILGTGRYLPSALVSNDEIALRAGVTSEWIERKTGIRQRRRAAGHEATSDLAAAAAAQALNQAGLCPERVSYVVVATSTPDHPQPATASIVQHLIGATGAAAFDVNSVCSGFVFALAIAERLLHGEPAGGYALVVGADIYSRILDYTDRKTAPLFGDGAGAVVLGPVPEGQGIITTSMLTRGDQHELICVPAGGSRRPPSPGTVAEGQHFFRMDGPGVRGFVANQLPGAIREVLDKAGVPAAGVDHFVPHQANGAMLGDIWPSLGLGVATCHLQLDRYGNTGAASVPITLDLVHRDGLFAVNDTVLLTGFGGGMSVGSAVLRWAPTRSARPPRSRPLASPAQGIPGRAAGIGVTGADLLGQR
jgi:3-oxoacyl-[acyl-carrier-protein] synthase-3